MKTYLLSFVLSIFILAAFGQSKFTKIVGPNKYLKVKTAQLHPAYGSSLQSEIIGQKLLDFTDIGTTWNDLQTLNFGNVMQRMWAYPDGTVGSSWLAAGLENVPERGAGYNYYNGSAWVDPNQHVGPPDRMGSPCYSPWGPEGEIIALYRYIANEGPIFLYKREVKGEGDWEEVELSPPAGVSLVWHSMITSGENHEHIHLLADTYDQPFAGQENALLYYRSSDGGETWDIAEQIIEGLGIDYFSTINHLSYAWANPVGNTIAFTYGFDAFGGRVFKSFDNGDTWEILPVFNSPFSSLEIPVATERFGCGIGTSAIALDSDGMAHVVFPRMNKIYEASEESYYPFTDGMIYWNETMEPLDTATISATTMDYLEEGGYLIGWVLGDETYEVPEGQPTYANAACAFPQISIDADDNLFVAYSSLAPGYNNGEFTYRHIIVNSSFNGGSYWEGQVDLHTELVFLFSECAFPMVPPVIQDIVHVTYQEDNEPGIAEWLLNHPPAENRIQHMEFEKSTFTGVAESMTSSAFEMSECYPNPASSIVAINVNLAQSSALSCVITNITGQVVKEIPATKMSIGNNLISIDVLEYSAGIYFCTVDNGTHRITKKFVVN